MAIVISRLIKDFVGHGKGVQHNGKLVLPEVKVTVASVYVDKKEDKGNGLLNYTFRADGAKYALGGFINSTEPIVKVFDAAQEQNQPICVRLEKKRKKNVDPTTPISDLTVDMGTAQKNITRIVVGIFDTRSNKWILSREAESNPAEDPEEILGEIDQLSFDTTGFFDKGEAPAQGATSYPSSSSKEQENKENALMTMYFFIAEQEKLHDFSLDPAMRRKCAIVLLRLANQLQEKHFGLSEPNYSAYSHARARFIIFKWAEVMDPLNQDAINGMRAWGTKLITEGVALWDWCEDVTKEL